MPEAAEPLVGIVVVSHSAKIAEGVVELARQMAGPDVRLIAAGGAIDGTLGTDAVVLADLGSAVLATKLALDMIAPETAARTRLSGGPLVEGAVVAAVQASVGDDVAAVVAAAEEAAKMPKEVA